MLLRVRAAAGALLAHPATIPERSASFMTAMLESHETGFPLLARGKVRDIYEHGGDELLIVTTDRISAFDVIMPTPIPGKGAVLTQVSNFWFAKTRHLIANHLVDPEPFRDDPARADLQGRSVVVSRCQTLPIEAIVRGYLAGSGLKDYQRDGRVCGIELPAGLVDGSRLPQTIFAPSTKGEVGTHDENIAFDGVVALVGDEVARRVRDASIALYEFAAAYALERGIIIADTKFEFGLLDGEVILIDEALTPDSSRFWPVDGYAPGSAQPSFDKQPLRDYLETLDWDKKAPGPALPPDIVAATSARYEEALRRLTAS
jgi:phosphoribosylaminoimidazole-succinocarboxamide synthase